MFVIARHSKIKSTGELRAALKHNCREQPTPNADPSKTPLNGGDNVTVNGAMSKYRQLLGDHKARKNAVHAVEYLFSASPEWFKGKERSEVLDYLRDCTNYVRDKFTAKNVISVRYHFDETTPHAHVVVVPMHNQKLNAKHYIGGSRAVAQQFQKDIGKLGQKYGLQRGQEGSTATHTTVQEFYKMIEEIGGDKQEVLKLINRGKLKEQNEENLGKAMTTAAKALKEANKKAGQYHAAKNAAENALSETKSLLKQTKADHAQALKDATLSHDKEAKKLRYEIDKLNKQVVALTNDRNRWKTRAKKADENAEKLWIEKNANYLENLEKDRYANRKNKRENEKRAEYLELESETLSREREELEDTKNRLEAWDNELAKRLDQTVTLSHDIVRIPDTVDPKAKAKLLDNIGAAIQQHHKAQHKAMLQQELKEAAQAPSDPDPLHTPTPSPEKAAKRKSGLTMG